MLIRRPQVRVYPKMMLSPQGEWVFALVVVAEYNGEIRVKVLFPENNQPLPLALEGAVSETAFYLSGEVANVLAQEKTRKSHRPVTSPYHDFSFTTCQQTRAPNR